MDILVVSGAGEVAANGEYHRLPQPFANGPLYRKGASPYAIFHKASQWWLADLGPAFNPAAIRARRLYAARGDQGVPKAGWWAEDGEEPTPLVAGRALGHHLVVAPKVKQAFWATEVDEEDGEIHGELFEYVAKPTPPRDRLAAAEAPLQGVWKVGELSVVVQGSEVVWSTGRRQLLRVSPEGAAVLDGWALTEDAGATAT
eukprot:CAMPEP_0204348938 /NCGR_PEP_ID=MMETSP0469-20131031/29117_1 /ASSEMBLY_ACC=CAM_ASM_000384 /TAXON_ID=2969 /ORGANISM="Oxyrrhis marina" /LENGTH=200 /DNA_ID=CAMNT_0051335015 /DNA_START=22 /DNA_END=620 /DNA_ORIENTATION=+